MPLVYVKSSGTRVSGESTPGDWSDANCYPRVSASVGAWTGATQVVLNDETITETTTVGTASFASLTSLSIEKRGASSTPAVWSMNSATAPLINAAPTAAQTFAASDIVFTRAVPMSAAATTALLAFSGTGYSAITFTRCTFGPMDIDGHLGGLNASVFSVQGTPVSRLVTLTDCVVTGINHISAGTGPWMRLGGTGNTFSFVNCSWRNCNYIHTSSAAACGFGILPENTQTFTFTNCTAEDLTVKGADSSAYVRCFYFTPTTAQTTIIRNFRFNRVVVGTEEVPIQSQGWGFYISGAYSVNGVHSRYCTYYETGNRDGGQIYFNGTGAIGSATDLSAMHCRSRSGAALFVSNGAGGVFSRVLAMYNISEAGVIYSGGYGDFELRVAISCYNSKIPGSNANDGLAVYVRNNAATRHKTARIANVIAVGNTTNGSCAGIAVENNDAVYSMTAEVINCISRNVNVNDIEQTATAAGALTVTARNCNVSNTISVTSNVNEVSGDPQFIGGPNPTTAEGFKLRPNSPLRRAGTCVYTTGCVPRDFGGRRGRVPPDIGAWQRN